MSTYYRDALSAWGETADKQVDQLSSVIASQEAELVAHQEELATSQAEIVRLQAIIDSLTPAPAKTPTAWGSSTGKHTYAYFTQMAGSPLKARRSYQQLGQQPPAEDFGRCVSIASVANNPAASWSTVKTALMLYLSKVPVDHDLRFIKSHEPENPNKGYSPAAYVLEQQRIRDEVIDPINAERTKVAGGKPIRFGGNWMAWSLQPNVNRPMHLWWPGDGVWDFLAADGYAGPEGGRTPASVFDPFVDFTDAKGVRFGIAECGIDVSRPVVERIAWIDACQLYTKNLDPEFWCYWDGSFSTFWLNTVEEFKAVVQHP